MDLLQDGIQGDTLSPMVEGPLESAFWRNALIFQESTIRHFYFQASLMNKQCYSQRLDLAIMKVEYSAGNAGI